MHTVCVEAGLYVRWRRHEYFSHLYVFSLFFLFFSCPALMFVFSSRQCFRSGGSRRVTTATAAASWWWAVGLDGGRLRGSVGPRCRQPTFDPSWIKHVTLAETWREATHLTLQEFWEFNRGACLKLGLRRLDEAAVSFCLVCFIPMGLTWSSEDGIRSVWEMFRNKNWLQNRIWVKHGAGLHTVGSPLSHSCG